MKKRRTNTGILLRLMKYALPYKGKILLLIILAFLGVGFSVLQPLPIKYIIDNVLSKQPLPDDIKSILSYFGGASNSVNLLILLVISAIIIVVFSALITFISASITTKICQRLVYDFSVVLFEKLQKMSVSFYSKNKIGDLMQRISTDTYVIYSIVGGIFLPTLISITTLGAMFYIMYSINAALALMAISIVPLYILLLRVFYKPMTDSSTKQYEVSGKLWSFIHQSISSVKIIQAYSVEKFTVDKFTGESLAYNDASVKSTRISMIYTGLLSIITGVATAIVVGIGAYKGLTGAITIGELFLFISYIAALFGPVSSLASIAATAVSIAARARRIFDIIDSDDIIPESPDAIDVKNVKGAVEMKNISFGYGLKGESKPILNDFNFEVTPGQMVAVVGPTGSGKTSMISLLLRFYDPWEGEIFLDGHNIRQLKISSLRRQISLVMQDSFIFPVTIAENIAFGNPHASKEEIIAAAKAAQADEFIRKLPHGYDTLPSEGGVSLSGGEKQRISLARAFLRNTPILILDEPTSALDVQTEAKIFEALSSYSSGRTVFIISHRLSTIRHADIIIAIKDGRIIEKGTHEKLISDGKLYAELHKFQDVE